MFKWNSTRFKSLLFRVSFRSENFATGRYKPSFSSVNESMLRACDRLKLPEVIHTYNRRRTGFCCVQPQVVLVLVATHIVQAPGRQVPEDSHHPHVLFNGSPQKLTAQSATQSFSFIAKVQQILNQQFLHILHTISIPMQKGRQFSVMSNTTSMINLR